MSPTLSHPHFPHLFTPLQIRNVTLRNRIAISGHHAGWWVDEGRPSDEFADYIEERARGGVGLFVIGCTSPKRGSGWLENVDDRIIPRYRKMVEAGHRHDTPIFAQLAHPGFGPLPGVPLVQGALAAPGTQPIYRGPERYVPSIAELHDLIASFGTAARRAAEGGVDGMEVHSHEWFLHAQMLNPMWNTRDDEYGGSLENRMRFLVETLRAMRAAVGPEMPLGVRLKADDMEQRGMGGGDYAECIRRLEAENLVDYVNLTGGDKPTFSFQVENLMAEPISFKGKVEVIRYALRTPGEDFFKVNFIKLADCGSLPFAMEIPAKGFKNFTVADLPIPETFGGYGLVVDCGQYGRLMGATAARVIKPSQATNPKPFPRVMMDGHYIDVLSRLGAVSNRIGTSMRPPSDPTFTQWHKEFGDQLKSFHAAHITTTIEFGGGPDLTHPLGKRMGEFKTVEGAVLPRDNAWLPKFDKDFQEQVRLLVAEYGWPKGPVVGVKLYNEPWEGGGIDGWTADSVRYREMYAAMAQGVEQARKETGVDVLIGGCDSTSNTFDKLFAKGPDDDYLKWLDFHSMHYQGMAIPAGYKPWRNRKDADGKPAPVRMWDTESWVANSDERVAAVLAAYCSVGYERVVGIFADGFIQGVEDIKIRTETGTQNRFIKRPWSPCAAVAGFSYMIGDRPFKELLFKNGLPWVMVFEGNLTPAGKANPEDGTVVVVGDLGPTFNADTLPFRTVKRQNAKMIITADGDAFGLYDSYANPVKTQRGTITLPLDGTGYYLRGDGKPGSFKKLLAAIESSRIEGIEPVEIKAHDLLAPVTRKPALRLSITNVLNRPVRGTLSTTLGSLTLENAQQTLSLKAHETQEVSISVKAGAPTNDNSYALKATFDANADGRVALDEVMHANVIARMTPTIDGQLNDWKSVVPQPVMVDGVVKPTTEELAWRPWEKFESKTVKGFAVGYLAYDDQHFYYAAKIADATPDEGMHRMENSNDDEWFYPTTVADKAGKIFNWPEGVRRFTYAKAPELPSGSFPNRDNVQIAFNVLSDAEKNWLPYMAGTRRDYGSVPTNDYEYALNPISEKYGGGTEIWRIQVPGMAEKNFYPHQPKGPLDGAVKLGKLAIKRDANTRYVEAAIPWAEIPHVRRALDEGKTIKFSFRINDNAGIGCMELAKNRGVAKRGSSFNVNWTEHWTNEVEFAFQK